MNRKKVLILAPALLLVVLGIALSGVHIWMRSDTEQEEKVGALKAVDHFHALLSSGRLDEIFDNADPTFRA